jgi:hypothetical protein
VQGRIAKNIFFRYNSVNVLIGQRGSGKTHFVLREVLKLLQYPDANYSTFFYSTNKVSKDITVEKFTPLLKGSALNIQVINHEETPEFIDALEEAKRFYNEFRKDAGITGAAAIPKYDPTEFIESVNSEKHILDEDEINERIMYFMPESLRNKPLNQKYKDMIAELKTLIIEPRGFNELYLTILQFLNVLSIENTTPHTIFFIDDCIDLVNKRGVLFKKLFENRQGKITYFLGLQDVHGIPSSMKSNMDSLVLFGGFSKQKYNSLFYQIPTDIEREKMYQDYHLLKKSDYIMFSFEADGIKKYINISAK